MALLKECGGGKEGEWVVKLDDIDDGSGGELLRGSGEEETIPFFTSSLTRVVSDVSQTCSVLNALGPGPDHEAIDTAKAKLTLINSSLSKKLEDLVLSPCPSNVDRFQWRAHLAEREQECRNSPEKDRQDCKVILLLDDLHATYEKLLKDVEERLKKIYRFVEDGIIHEELPVFNQLHKEVIGILHQANGIALDRVNLSGRCLRFLPEAFGRIARLLHLDLSSNDLKFGVIVNERGDYESGSKEIEIEIEIID
ncbi:hypothetical protein ACLB2K_066736 [Fragaria x ananassa]